MTRRTKAELFLRLRSATLQRMPLAASFDADLTTT